MKIDYNQISQTYDTYRSYSDTIIKQIIELGNLKDEMTILDLGCGTGNVSTQLRTLLDADIIGIDKSISMLGKARIKTLNVLCADADNVPLPFDDKTFDAVIGAYMIHQIINLEDLFLECHRVLRHGPLILITSSHEQIESQHPIMKETFPRLIDLDKKRFPDIPQIDALFTSAGFEDMKYEEVSLGKTPINMEYLDKVKNKYISTFHLLPETEFQEGVEKLEDFIKNTKQPVFREWKGTVIYGKKPGELCYTGIVLD